MRAVRFAPLIEADLRDHILAARVRYSQARKRLGRDEIYNIMEQFEQEKQRITKTLK